MKRVIAVLMVVAVAMCFCGCQEDLKEKLDKKLDCTITFYDEPETVESISMYLTKIPTKQEVYWYASDYYKAYFKDESDIHEVINPMREELYYIRKIGDVIEVDIWAYNTAPFVDMRKPSQVVGGVKYYKGKYEIDVSTGAAHKVSD